MSFKPKRVEIEDLSLLQYDKVKSYFEDAQDVLQVSNSGKIDIVNFNKLLTSFSSQPNVYGLLTRGKIDSKWRLRYVGQRKSKGIRQRLREHLFKCAEKTGSQLKNVQDELSKGNEIGLKLLSVNHDELRHFFESRLINDIETDWNTQR